MSTEDRHNLPWLAARVRLALSLGLALILLLPVVELGRGRASFAGAFAPLAPIVVGATLLICISAAYEARRYRRFTSTLDQRHATTAEALREQEVQLRSVFEHVQDIIYRTDLQGIVQMVSPSVERYGYRVNELLGRDVNQLYAYPNGREQVLEALRDKGAVNDVELLFRRSDGTLISMSATARLLRDETGRPVATEGILRDISARKMADAALAASEARLRALVQNSSDLITIVDDDSSVRYVSPAAARILGYKPAQLIGESTAQHVHPDDRQPLRALFTELLNHPDQARRIEYRVRHASGSWVQVESIASNLLRDPAIRGIVLNTRDVTDRKHSESELRTAKESAEVANRAKSQFLATVSHEIRSPMNAVIGWAGLLLESPLQPEQQEYAQGIRRAGDALLAIINDVLDFSKIEAGKLALEITDFDLRQAIDEVVDLVLAPAQRKGLQLASLIYHDVPPLLRGDPGRLRQILVNLLGNAVKFTERGEVMLRVKLAETQGASTTLRFEVADTGIGIAPEARARLFEAFSQADMSTTREYGGTGLGLAISKRLTELMQGEIGVESQGGVGSTFWFTARFQTQPRLAAASTHPATPSEPAVGTAACYGVQPRILVAEDNALNQHITVRMLEKLGYRVDVAANGIEALRALERAAYVAVLMDCQMPELDGFEATARIRAQEQSTGQRIPIIAVTTGALPGDRERCLAAGMDDHVPKPVTRDQLAAALQRSIPRPMPIIVDPSRTQTLH
ncbi:MAG: PAS domain S-box protein [Deltaproteobacteria bacterium]|nr:PAS domain S-box protein [Deltaproteobacteria bacterium]MBI3389919.1 PAS domain S-box protein [Deltaproteobacteria bacterium]